MPVSFPLSLKLLESAAHPPGACFIPGAEPRAWLEEIGRWKLPTSTLRLYVVPVSARDRTPIGVLVTTLAEAQPTSVLRALPYGRLAGRLFLPAEAALWPPVAEPELRQLLIFDVQVLHPSAGLVGFEQRDALAVHDLLVASPGRDIEWDRATAAEQSRWRLLAVEPERLPGLLEIMGQGRDDIGSEPTDVLPPTPEESKLKDLARRAIQPPLKLLKFLSDSGSGGATRPPSKPGGKPGFLRRMNDWTNEKLANIAESLWDARQRELERLRRMLEEDPDEGLRHAIPLRDWGTRGQAPPSASLGTRDVNFNLSQLRGGSKPGDQWDIEASLRNALTERYRDAANRELRLGRHRRAAYIFAQLLGDFSSAANALEQGRHFREAAALYRDHLDNRLKAAQCLEQGGLLSEAIGLYEELKQFEQAGDLWTKIDRSEDAARCYRAQVERHRARRELTRAARLLEEKLDAADEALALLSAAWPLADSSGECLRASFDLLARLAQHEETSRRITKMRDGLHAPPGRGATLARVLADVATTYPEQNVRALCADATRVIGGTELASALGGERSAITRSVGRLVPEDRLLARDVERFLTKRAARPLPTPMPGGKNPVVLRQFHLPDGVEWKAVASDGDIFYAIGDGTMQAGDVWVVRGRWDGAVQQIGWRMSGPSSTPWSLHPVPGRPELIVTPIVSRPDLLAFPKSDVFPSTVALTQPAWLPERGLMALAHSDRAFTWAIFQNPGEGPVLNAYGTGSGALLVSHALAGLTPPPDDGSMTMLARSAYVFATWGTSLLQYGPGGLRVEAMPARVRRLAATSPQGTFRLAVGLELGGLLFSDVDRHVRFGDDLDDPLLTFTRGGALVAASTRLGRVYNMTNSGPTHRGEFAPTRAVFALTPTNHLNEFAMFDVDGRVTVLQLPE